MTTDEQHRPHPRTRMLRYNDRWQRGCFTASANFAFDSGGIGRQRWASAFDGGKCSQWAWVVLTVGVGKQQRIKDGNSGTIDGTV
jgi:hypothetical protein